MRIAITNWSNRVVGGAEQYLGSVGEYLRARGHELGLWHEAGNPEDSPLIPLGASITSWNVSELGPDRALAALAKWRPDVIYGQGMQNPALERETLRIAPSVFFAHNHHGTCISGSKAHLFPVPRPCNRRFGAACLVHYLPRRCGGLNPITMVEQYQLNVRRLGTLRHYSVLITHGTSLAHEYRDQGIRCEKVRFFAGVADAPKVNFQAWSPASSWRLLMMGRMMATKGGSLLLDALPEIVWRLKKTCVVDDRG